MTDERTTKEEFKISGEEVVETVKRLVKESNVRRITIKNEEGTTLIVIPLTVAIIGTVLVPILAAVGALAALLTRCTIVVERKAQ